MSDHWDTYGPGAVGVGWEMGLMGLALYLKSPNELKLDEAEFAVSPDGKAFIAGSSEAWGNAAVAGGTAPHDCVLYRRIDWSCLMDKRENTTHRVWQRHSSDTRQNL